MLVVHEDGPDDHKELEGDHPDAKGRMEELPEHAVDESRFMDLMDIYSVIDEEEDDDELIGYLGAMHLIKDTLTGSDNKIVYCRVMNTTYRELPQRQPISVEDKGQQVPEGLTGEDNQEWTWEEPYGAVHQGDFKDCTCYSRHLREALGNDIPSAIVATNYPSTMAQCEFDRGWDAYEHAEVYSKWAVTQKEIRGDNGGPHYEVVYCTYMRETTDGEVSPEEEASTSDSRGNYPTRAHSPQGHLYHEPEEDYGPSFLYNGLVAETIAPRAPQAETDNKWGWTPSYSILHTGPCDRCEGYQQHLATAIGIGVPLVVTAGNYP